MKSFLTVTEIAKVTGKERSTVIRWIKAGKFGEVTKVGGDYQVPQKSFDKWWAENVKAIKRRKRQEVA